MISDIGIDSFQFSWNLFIKFISITMNDFNSYLILFVEINNHLHSEKVYSSGLYNPFIPFSKELSHNFRNNLCFLLISKIEKVIKIVNIPILFRKRVNGHPTSFKMSFGITALNAPILISDAAIIHDFDGRQSAIIIARGSLLQFYSYNNFEGLKLRSEYKLFGEVARIVPIHHISDTQTNILLIFCDFRYSIIRYIPKENNLKTVQAGNLASSSGVPIDPPFKIAVSPASLLLQLHQQVVQYFQIVPNSLLGPPVNCSIPAKHIIDFDFLNTGDGTRFAVLTEDFSQSTKLQIYEIDTLSQTFSQRTNNTITLQTDSYAIKVIDSNSLVVFTTASAIKVTLNVASPRQRSSTIYTSHPLIKFARMDSTHFIAADMGNNLISISLQDGDLITVMRIGPINTPIALLPFDDKNLISLAQSGESSSINLMGDINHLIAETKPLMVNCGSVKKIVEVSNNEMIGICGDGFSHVIRQSLIMKELASIQVEGVDDLWIFNDEIIVSVYGQTYVLGFDGEKIIRKERYEIINNEPTICFRQISEDDFIQVTASTLSSNSTRLNLGLIIHASISDYNVGILLRNENNFTVKVFDYHFNETLSLDLDYSAEEVAINKDYLAVSSWAENIVYVYSLSNGKIVRTFSDFSSIADMKFTTDYFVVLETREHINFFSLCDESVNIRIHCDGLHYSIIPYDGNDVIISGENPILIQNLMLKGFKFPYFLKGSHSNNKFALADDSKLTICLGKGFSMTVHEDRSFENNIIDTIQIANPNKDESVRGPNFVVATRKGKSLSLYVAEHPLSNLTHVITKEEVEPYIGMASIYFNSMKFVAIIFGQHLILFELCDDNLQERSKLDLSKVPFQISAFGSKFIVAFTDEFQLYEPDVVSHSDIRLKKLTNMLTQGSTSCLSNDDEFVAVCDELQSLVLYAYDDSSNKFCENARNCIDFGLSMCRVSVDDYFCVDHCGNFFQMQIGETKNIESSDLDILSCYALGDCISSMIVFQTPKKDSEEETATKLLIGKQNSQYLEVVKFDPPEQFKLLYTEMEKEFQSLGRLSSRGHRTVLFDNYLPQCPTMYNFDLLKMYLELDENSQQIIATHSLMNVQTAKQICDSLLKLT
ncbi:hypothetical protein TRFO_19527 [Tritrichomonas foetus]|uniref:DNA damage-binding protein 1 n=1 Tax=Tritrichomonas foetus TaxID=1144522 RepID=A0A1J4KIB4_9EUKA|nr:hypothetical protein TRFO_19527 [Tritrichomonas foetus]|eukprot:OHT10955.1 hypothetical protein TRFO_19527 [Tritrichomonas foetus]